MDLFYIVYGIAVKTNFCNKYFWERAIFFSIIYKILVLYGTTDVNENFKTKIQLHCVFLAVVLKACFEHILYNTAINENLFLTLLLQIPILSYVCFILSSVSKNNAFSMLLSTFCCWWTLNLA